MNVSNAQLKTNLAAWAKAQGIDAGVDALSDAQLAQASKDLKVAPESLQAIRDQALSAGESAAAAAGKRSAALREAVGDASGGRAAVRMENSPVMGRFGVEAKTTPKAEVTGGEGALEVKASVFGSGELFPATVSITDDAVKVRNRDGFSVAHDMIMIPDIDKVEVAEGLLFSDVVLTVDGKSFSINGLGADDAARVADRIRASTGRMLEGASSGPRRGSVSDDGDNLKIRASMLGSGEFFPANITVTPEAIQVRDREGLFSVDNQMVMLPDVDSVEIEQGFFFSTLVLTVNGERMAFEGLAGEDAQKVAERIRANTAALLDGGEGYHRVRSFD